MVTTADVQISGVEQKRCWDAGILPPVERVRPGLWSIPVPIPVSPLRYVLVYALELAGDRGVALVDAGWDTDEAWAALSGGLGVAGYGVPDVRAVLVTHIHPDHYGLAAHVRQASGAWVALHPADAAMLPGRYGLGVSDLLAKMRGLLLRCGVPEEESAQLTSASMGIKPFIRMAEPDVLLADGDRPELPGWDLTSVWTPGHSPGHLCFASTERRLVLTGDHVLPRISPNISIHAQYRTDPLADFLDTLAKVGRLDDGNAVEEVLPAHEYRFRGLAARVAAIIAHHDARLADVERLLRAIPGATCWELSSQLSWARPWEEIRGYMRRAANGETLAHLVLLEGRGRVRRTRDVPERWSLT